jgi:hypothetical protein
MTMQPSPDLLDLAEAVAAGTLRADDAERQLRSALEPDHAAESEQAVRELRGLIGAAGAVRAHARATREAFGSASQHLAPKVATTPASIATLVPGRVTAGAVHPHSSNGGDGAGRAPRRTWLLAAAALLLVGGAMAAGSGAVKLPSLVPPVALVPTPSPAAETLSPAISTSPAPTETSSDSSARPSSWTATGDVIGPRWVGTAVLLQNGDVLVVGGNSVPWPPDAEVYHPATGTWAPTGQVITPRVQLAAARLLDGRVLVVGGAGDASAELYDPSTGSWTATGKLHTARYDSTATLLPDGKVLVAGGTIVTHSFNPSVAAAELYDPATGTWASTGEMHTARSQHNAMLVPGGKVLVVGGWNENDTLSYPLSSAEIYDPASGTWAAAHDMLEATAVQSATLLANGRVLVVGGTYEPPTPESVSPHEGIAATAELYDPAADEWTMTGHLGKTVRGYTATLLSDGRVLVTGGMDRPWIGNVPASASGAVYDPSTGTWGATSAMHEGRSEHTATLLPNGMVLVAGGIIGLGENEDGPGNLGLRSSAELYDPGSP